MTTPLVIRAANPQSINELRDELTDAFVAVRGAVVAGQPVAIVVTASDLLGQRSVCGAAYANALVGIARAAGFEGSRAGWSVNVVAVPDGTELDYLTLAAAVGDLGLSGQIVTLGTGLVGKVIP